MDQVRPDSQAQAAELLAAMTQAQAVEPAGEER